MARLIAARVATQERGQMIVDALRKQQFGETQVFYLNPPGQDATHPLGGDRTLIRAPRPRPKARQRVPPPAPPWVRLSVPWPPPPRRWSPPPW